MDRHGGNAGLCEEDHVCPACSSGEGPENCYDLFHHHVCGLVACARPMMLERIDGGGTKG